MSGLDFAARGLTRKLQADLGSTSEGKGASLVAGLLIPANSRTALADIDESRHPEAYLAEGGLEGVFSFEPSDMSAQVAVDTPQGIYIAPASDPTGASGAWVRKFDGPALIDWFGGGADKTGAQNTDALNGALAITGIAGLRPGTTYTVAGPVALDTGGYVVIGPDATIVHDGANVLFAAGAWRDGSVRIGEIVNNPGAGHIFEISGIVRSALIDIPSIRQNSQVGSLIKSAIGATFYGSVVANRYYRTGSTAGAPVSGVPMIDWSSDTNSFSGNKIRLQFAYGTSDAPLISIACTGGSVYNYGNEYDLPVCEICDGGILHLAGEASSRAIIGSYDIGTLTDDAVRLSAAGGGNRCVDIAVTYKRNTGSDGGFHDIALESAYNTRIIANAHSPTSAILIDNNNMVGTEVTDAPNYPATIINEATRRARRTYRLADARPGSQRAIVGGVFALNFDDQGQVLYRKIDTENTAATDVLDTITGGYVGQILYLGTLSNGRDVTVADSAAITLDGGADITLDRTDDMIGLLCTGTDTWKQIAFTNGA